MSHQPAALPSKLQEIDTALAEVGKLMEYMREKFPYAHRETRPIIDDLVKAQTKMEDLRISITHKKL
jgi:hypothetical protein